MSGHHTRLRWCNQQQCLSKELNAEIKKWLFDSGSLTTRLISHCDKKFSVNVLSMSRATPTPDEIKVLNLKPRSQAIIRQVLLLCGDRPVVYARTIIPLSSMRGSLRGVVLLGNQSLGAVLFADKKMQRKPMQVTSVKSQHKFQKWMQYTGEKTVWGRRSVFVLKKQNLLVSEFFLPELFD